MTGKLRKGAVLLAGGLMLTLAGPAWAAALPTPEAAFRLVPHAFGDAEWTIPVHPEAVFPTRSGFALLMSGSEHDCVACGARLSVAYFRKGPRGWRPQRVWRDLLRLGWEGKVDRTERFAAGRGGPLIALHTSVSDQACDRDAVALIELTSARPIVRMREAPVRVSDWNRVTDTFAFYEASIKPMAGGRGVVFDYRAELKGRHWVVTYTGAGGRWTPRPGGLHKGCW